MAAGGQPVALRNKRAQAKRRKGWVSDGQREECGARLGGGGEEGRRKGGRTASPGRLFDVLSDGSRHFGCFRSLLWPAGRLHSRVVGASVVSSRHLLSSHWRSLFSFLAYEQSAL